jgi:hypothetical protein
MNNNIFIYVKSRTCSSSLEIALNVLGYNTIYLTPSRIKNDHEKKRVYYHIINNFNDGKLLLNNINCNYNCFIFSEYLYLDIFYREYPESKFIQTDRNIDEWIISFKRHQKRNNREILTTQKYTEQHIEYKNKFINFVKDKPNISYCIFNASSGDDYNKLCSFLNK